MPKLILVPSHLGQSTVVNFQIDGPKSRRPQNWTFIFIEFYAQGFSEPKCYCVVATITKCIFESIENHRFKIKLQYKLSKSPNESNKNFISNTKEGTAQVKIINILLRSKISI